MKYTKYIKPSDIQKAHIEQIDEKADMLYDLMCEVVSNERYRALAKTSLEQAVMWINKGIYTATEKSQCTGS